MDGPSPDVPRWQPPSPVRRRVARKAKTPALLLPLVWWASHPWVVVWLAVFLAPFAVVVLRVIDDDGYGLVVTALTRLFVAALVVAFALAVLVSSRRSAGHAAGGVVAATLVLALLVLPLLEVTLGHTPCPARAPGDIGVAVAGRLVEAWQTGSDASDLWEPGPAQQAWAAKREGLSLLAYQRVDAGCWERVAPVPASPTWHEYRVMVQQGDAAPLWKVLLVHTASDGGPWRVSSVEGPLP